MISAKAQSIKKLPTFVFWLLWVLVTLLAWSIILTINVLLGSFDHVKALWLAGLIEGLLQWLVLRQRIHYGIGWVIVTALATFLVGMTNLLGGALAATFTLLFVSVGVAQVLVLQKTTRRAGWWLAVKVIAYAFMALVSALPLLGVLYSASGDPAAWAVLGLIAGGAYGAVSGLGLVFLLRDPVAVEGQTGRPRRILTPVNVIATLVSLMLFIAPFFAIGQTYFLQNQVYCNVLKIGMPRVEVNTRLSNVRPITENGALFGNSEGGSPYPASLTSYASQVVNFYNVQLEDPLITVPQLGLGYDQADNLALISSDLRSYSLEYQLVKCPWSIQYSLDTLFK